MDWVDALHETPDLCGEIEVLDYRAVFNGSYSCVYKGRMKRTDELVAIKVLNPIRGAGLSTMRRKIERERKTWSSLWHPNILPLYGFADDHKLFTPFGGFISPWRKRGDLGQFLFDEGENASLKVRLQLWQGVVAGVHHLHSHQPLLVHGDLKPGNVLIDDDWNAQLCDFGLVRIYLSEGHSGMTTTSPHYGTERYLAWELVTADEDAIPTAASDIYATGCIGLEALFLEQPYSRYKKNVRGQIMRDMDEGKPPAFRPTSLIGHLDSLWEIVSWCWASDPLSRPQAHVLLTHVANTLATVESLEQSVSAHGVGKPQSRLSSPETRSKDHMATDRSGEMLVEIPNSPNLASKTNIGDSGGEQNSGIYSVVRQSDGSARLEQLRYSGGSKDLVPGFPPITPNYVERKLPMELIENMVFEAPGSLKTGSKRIIVTGIGGCGKTKLIQKFVEKYKDLFVSTFFIDGSSPDAIRGDIIRNVRALGPAHSRNSFDQSMTFLAQASHNGERLLVINNLDDPTLDLDLFLPRWDYGVVVITSRDHSRGQLDPKAHLQLDIMTLDESVELLVRGSGLPWPPAESDRRSVLPVAEELGCHPIALIQAISYMYNTGSSPGSYITLLRSHRDRLLRDHPATNQVDMRFKTAFAAFDASYNILPLKARDFWHLLSFFQWQKFPVELITRAASCEFSTQRFLYLPRGDEFELGREALKNIFYTSNGWDPIEFQSILATLQSQSLITASPAENATLLRMHPLVHEWGRLRMSKRDFPRLKAAAVRLLCCGASEDNYSMMQYLFSHVEAMVLAREHWHVNDVSSMSFILAESGIYDKATTLNYSVYQQLSEVLGPAHPNTVTASENLAVTYGRLGRYAEAEELQIEVLNQRSQQLGVDSHLTVAAKELLAAFSHDLGRYQEARELKSEVLKQRERMLGRDHPHTIRASGQLAATYHKLGLYAEAEVLEKEVLRQRRQRLGMDHPDTARASVSLAVTYQALGCYAEAEELIANVLRQRNRLLGVDHPDTIEASARLAVIYHISGRYAEAEELQTQALRKRKKLLGENHPDTIEALAGLAVTCHAVGRYIEAEELQKDVSRRQNLLLGPDHPETIRALDHLAVTYSSLGRLDEAKELVSEVLERRTLLLGREHPDTIRAMLSLARTYNAMQRQGESSLLAQEALGIASKTLGKGHPIYLDISAFLGNPPGGGTARVNHGPRSLFASLKRVASK